MLIELYIFAFSIITYGVFTTLALIGFSRLKSTTPSPNNTHNEGLLPYAVISIIISARNEAENIEACLHQIIKQNFDKNHFELLLVDDASEDATYDIAKRILESSALSYQLIKHPTHQGKKHNFAEAITIAKGSIIITSDADVVYRHANWLSTIAHYFENFSPNLLIMPIDFENHKGLLPVFQIVENVALTAITAGYAGIQKAFMCNGANLAFKKKAYEMVNGYTSHFSISSGEDVFLLEDLKKINPVLIHYSLSRELIVKTKPQQTISSFIHQRLRWAYKAKYNSNIVNLFAGFIVLLTSLIYLALFVALLKQSVILPYLLIFATAKFVFDFLLLFLAADFLGRIKYIGWLIPFESIYWMYALTIGIVSLFFKPYWKGKKVH